MWLSVRRSRSWVDGTPGIRLFVADNGCGMTRATRQRIFEPFFTTKETTGTGLGLWVSSEIIAKHNATVRVASRPAEAADGRQSGTVFMLFFPEDGIGVPPVPATAAAAEWLMKYVSRVCMRFADRCGLTPIQVALRNDRFPYPDAASDQMRPAA